MVPNSSAGRVAPPLRYGRTEEPFPARLAKGQEIPCLRPDQSLGRFRTPLPFPTTASSARGLAGREVPACASPGTSATSPWPRCAPSCLAFRLYDRTAAGLQKDLGITCALVPTTTRASIPPPPLPLNAMFMNGPTRGKDVFMPLDFIIGGPKMAGQAGACSWSAWLPAAPFRCPRPIPAWPR